MNVVQVSPHLAELLLAYLGERGPVANVLSEQLRACPVIEAASEQKDEKKCP